MDLQREDPILNYRIKIKGKDGLLRCIEFVNPPLSFSKFLEEFVKKEKDLFSDFKLKATPHSFKAYRVFLHIFHYIYECYSQSRI